jgi:hypothetical protein
MEKAAKFSAIVLIILGLLVILGGFAFGVFSTVRLGLGPLLRMQAMPFGRGLPFTNNVGLGFLVMAIAFIQGISMIGMGEGLYLLSKLASNPGIIKAASQITMQSPITN